MSGPFSCAMAYRSDGGSSSPRRRRSVDVALRSSFREGGDPRALLLARHPREGGDPWTSLPARHSGEAEASSVSVPRRRESSDFALALARHPREGGDPVSALALLVIPAKAGIHGRCFQLVIPAKRKASSSSSPQRRGSSDFALSFTSNAFAFGELLFFERPQRKVTKRKRPFPTRRNRRSESSTDFQTRHPWLD